MMEWRPQKEGIATQWVSPFLISICPMEWRPQKEGIATEPINFIFFSAWDWMEWRPQKEGIATHARLLRTRTRPNGWNGDLKKKGLRLSKSLKFEGFMMEWRPQKEGIATFFFISFY